MGEAKRRRLAEAKARAEAAAAAPVAAMQEAAMRELGDAIAHAPLRPYIADGEEDALRAYLLAGDEEIAGVRVGSAPPPPPPRALPKGIVIARTPIPLGPLGAMPRIALRLPPPPTTPGPRGRKR